MRFKYVSPECDAFHLSLEAAVMTTSDQDFNSTSENWLVDDTDFMFNIL